MYKQRLEEYIEKDKIYQAYKKQKEIETSDFDNFCILHCEDIEEALFDLEQLKKENNQLKEQRQELRSWLEDWLKIIEKQYDKLKEPVRKVFLKVIIDTLKEVLSKLNELEGKNE